MEDTGPSRITAKRRRQLGGWLIAAIEKERVDRALELVYQGADLTVCGAAGYTALYAAIAYKCYPVVQPLLAAGADPNVPGPRGDYPIHAVAEYGGDDAPGLVEALIAYGAPSMCATRRARRPSSLLERALVRRLCSRYCGTARTLTIGTTSGTPPSHLPAAGE